MDSPAWLINHSASSLRGFVDAAIKEGTYHYIIFHGIGPSAEWGGQKDGDAFVALLDYLVDKKDLVWSETFTKIYKYAGERDHSHVATEEVSDNGIRVTLTSELDTTPGMFDYPVTLRTYVPLDWKTCTVQQANHSAVYSVEGGVVQYSALPNAGEISILLGGTLVSPSPSHTALPSPPPSPPAPPVLPTRAVEDFNYSSDSELNHAWWILPCGNDTSVSLLPVGSDEGRHGMSYVYASGDKGTSGRVRRNTSLDLSPYKYLSVKFKPSNTSDTITFQFMEAIQSEFWETSFKPNSSARQTIVIPLTKEYFHHPIWFTGSDADGVIDLSNVKLISLSVRSNGAGSVVFDAIEASKEAPLYADFSTPVTAVTPALTETGRCRVAK